MTEKELRQHNKFLNIAEEIATDSKCVQLHVGALLVKNKRIISTGYNGTPAGYINCNDYCKQNYNSNKFPNRELHHDFSEKYEIHAEVNAVLYAAREGNSIKGCDIYITHQPCMNCLKMLCGAGICNIYYRYRYDKFHITNEIKQMLQDCNINLIKVDKPDLHLTIDNKDNI